MKIMCIYPNAEGYSRIPLGMALIMTILHNEGHEIKLFDTSFLRGENVDNIVRQKSGFVPTTDISNLYESYTDDEIDGILRLKIKFFSPDVVITSIVEDNYRYATHLLKIVKSVDKNIITVAGGSTPTVVPKIVMENPYIDYVIQGEGEEAIVELCDALQHGEYVGYIQNLWWRDSQGNIWNNFVRPFIDMNKLPIQNLSFWDNRHFMKPYAGKVYKSGYVELSRGCMNKCTYCINHTLQSCLSEAGKYCRRKSVSKLIEEVKVYKSQYGIERIFFTDDNFLFMPTRILEEFVEVWKEVGLPYWINTTAETINNTRLDFLKESGCDGISIGVESGSEWLRTNILNRKTKNSTIIDTFELIHKYGIRTSSNIMMGFPGESEYNLFESISLLKTIEPKAMDVSFVTPYMGTVIHKLATKLGMIETMNEPGFTGFAKFKSMREPCINIPGVSKERLMEIFNSFTDYVRGVLPIPDLPVNSPDYNTANVMKRILDENICR